MTKMTKSERDRFENAILRGIYPLALKDRLSPAQLEDLVRHVADSGRIFLTASDELDVFTVEDVYATLKEDATKAHLFKTDDEAAAKPSSDFERQYAIPKDQFDRLPAQRKLELANNLSARELTRA